MPAELFLSLLILIALLVSCVGIGNLIETKLLHFQPANIASAAVIGFCVLTILGAIPTALSVSGSITNAAFLLAGILCFVYAIVSGDLKRPESKPMVEWVPLIILVVVTMLHAYASFPSGAFNHHDDFYKYLPRLAQITQSGSLPGTPFNGVGSTGLAVQAYMQAYFVAFTGLGHANGFDFVFCFLLGGLLLDRFAVERSVHIYVRIGLMLSYVVLHPMYANITPVYVSIVLFLGIAYFGYRYLASIESGNSGDEINHWLLAVICAMGSLAVAFKFTNAAWVVLLFGFAGVWAAIKLTGRDLVKAISFAIPAAILPFLAWFLLALGNLVQLEDRVVDTAETSVIASTPQATAPTAGPPTFMEQLGHNIAANMQIPYGGRLVEYVGIVLTTLLAAALLFFFTRTRVDRRYGLLMVLTCYASFTIYIVAFPGMGINDWLRYNMAALLAPYWVVMILLAARDADFVPERLRFRYLALVPVLAWPTISQAGLFVEKTTLQVNDRIVAIMPVFRFTKGNALFLSNDVLHPIRQENTRNFQNLMTEGASILTFFESAHQLDYARNRILTLENLRPFAPLTTLDHEGKKAWMKAYLEKHEIDYIVIQADRTPTWWGSHSGRDYRRDPAYPGRTGNSLLRYLYHRPESAPHGQKLISIKERARLKSIDFCIN